MEDDVSLEASRGAGNNNRITNPEILNFQVFMTLEILPGNCLYERGNAVKAYQSNIMESNYRKCNIELEDSEY